VKYIASCCRECLEVIDGVKYLTTHRYRGDADNRYICLEFIRKSSLVVQIRASRLSDVMDRRLCDEAELVLNEWPMVDHANPPLRSQNCPLQVRLYLSFI